MLVSFTAAEIAAITQAKEIRGKFGEEVRGLAALAEAGPGELSFLGNAKYKTQVAGTRASVVLLPLDFPGEPQPGQIFLLVDNPSIALAQVCARIEQKLWPKPAAGVHPSAVVAAGAKVAVSATIAPSSQQSHSPLTTSTNSWATS